MPLPAPVNTIVLLLRSNLGLRGRRSSSASCVEVETLLIAGGFVAIVRPPPEMRGRMVHVNRCTHRSAMTVVVLKARAQDSTLSSINFSQSPENHHVFSLFSLSSTESYSPKHRPHVPRFAIINVFVLSPRRRICRHGRRRWTSVCHKDHTLPCPCSGRRCFNLQSALECKLVKGKMHRASRTFPKEHPTITRRF